jgi:hypothetical protein
MILEMYAINPTITSVELAYDGIGFTIVPDYLYDFSEQLCAILFEPDCITFSGLLVLSTPCSYR